MTEPLNATELPQLSKSERRIVLAGVGMVLVLCICSFMPAMLIRNGRWQLFESSPAAAAEPFVYTGQQIYTVPAGSRNILALSHSSQAPVVVMFDAEWCVRCQNLRPRLEHEIENQSGDMMLVIVDIDECPRLKSEYRVNSVPLVIAFVDGREVDRFVGEYDQAQVRQFLANLPNGEQ
jgi:thiol-disulfide isomerase/thioredoxin